MADKKATRLHNFCGTCGHFWPNEYNNGIVGGQCKRLPPVIVQEERRDSYGNTYIEASSQQPWVNAKNDWCSEWGVQ